MGSIVLLYLFDKGISFKTSVGSEVPLYHLSMGIPCKISLGGIIVLL